MFPPLRRPAHPAHLSVALAVTTVLCLAVPWPPQGQRDATAEAANIAAIHMVDPRIGWAIADVGTPIATILRTTDGGTAWTDVTPAAHPVPDGPVSAAFLDARHAWVTMPRGGGTTARTSRTLVFRTDDGGRSWRATRLPIPAALQVDFIDPRHGWVMAAGGVAAGSMATAIFSTADGGARWARLSTTDAPGASPPSTPGSLPFGGDKSGLGFRDTTTGFASGFDATGRRPWFYVTHDGGRTWRYQGFPLILRPEDGLSTSPARFFTPRDGILDTEFSVDSRRTVGPDGVKTAAVFYVTHDGGATWHPTTPLTYRVGDNRFSWDFSDARHGWATAGTTLYVTADSGRHWAAITPNRRFRHVLALDVIDPHGGWAIESANPPYTWTMLTTSDGGRTWVTLHPYVVPRPPGATAHPPRR